MTIQRQFFAYLAVWCGISQSWAKENMVERVQVAADKGSSGAVIVRDAALVHTNQILPTSSASSNEPKTGVAEDVKSQIDKLLENLRAGLEMSESDLASVVKLNVYVTDTGAADAMREAIRDWFQGNPPAVSWVTTQLPLKDAKVALDAVAVARNSQARNVVAIGEGRDVGALSGPAATILPAGPRVYISGQAEKGDGTLADATRQTLKSLLDSLEFLKLNRSHVVQLKAFLTPMSDVEVVQREVATFFDGYAVPPLVCVAWTSTLPIEIELIASAAEAESGPSRAAESRSVEYLETPSLKHSPVFSRIARVTHPTSIYLSGLFAGGERKSAEQEVRDLLTDLSKLVEKSGSNLRHLVKATYYVTDDGSSNGLNKLRPEFYDPARPPTASKAIVEGVGFAGHRLTLDMIAVPKE